MKFNKQKGGEKMKRFDLVFFRLGMLYVALIVPFAVYLEVGNYIDIILLSAASITFGICAFLTEKKIIQTNEDE
ncbi:MAG: hypothetical protein GF365_03795 [Candidatus Buchananbacteria bacterium]|nr:hypothetical protein [Candidatus Buchananbacteria bacterium]